MQKILSTEQIRGADSATIQREPISSDGLMERAAEACVQWIVGRYDKDIHFSVFAGIGNNGGDALVISRKLIQKGYEVETYLVRFSEKFSADCQINLQRLREMNHEVTHILEDSQIPGLPSGSIVIDGLFGAGLNRPVKGFVATCIEQFNASLADVISIDMPSGMFADAITPIGSAVVNATHTLTFQTPKLSFLLPEGQEYIDRWHVLPIGLDRSFLSEAQTDFYFIDNINDFAYDMDRRKFDHKGIYGHGLIVAGSHGMMGAAVLSGKAALRTGIGKLSLHIPRVGYPIVQTALPEAMCKVDDYIEFIGDVPDMRTFDAIGLGPGLGLNKKTRRAIKTMLMEAKVPLVIDADALNLIASHEDGLKWIPKAAIITPHVKEFERLFGKFINSFERLKMAKKWAKKLEITIVLKGAHTAVVSSQGKVYFNNTGNPGMATAGSGDVLTGMITALLSRGIDPVQASITAVYLHGSAGDFASVKFGQNAMIASDIIESISDALLNLQHK